MSRNAAKPLLRDRASHAKVTNEELFFDLIYAFAVTQLSHRLLDPLTLTGAMQTLVLWFAVWLGWQYACWVTNWFNPENLRVRLMLFALMSTAGVRYRPAEGGRPDDADPDRRRRLAEPACPAAAALTTAALMA